MAKKRAKPRKPSSKSKRAAKGGTTAERLKQAYTATQIKLMQRDLKPVDFDFSFATLDEIKAYNEKLAHLVLQRQLDGRDHGSLQNGIRNATIALIGPSRTEINVNTEVNLPAILAMLDKLLPTLPEDEQVVLARAVNKLATAET